MVNRQQVQSLVVCAVVVAVVVVVVVVSKCSNREKPSQNKQHVCRTLPFKNPEL